MNRSPQNVITSEVEAEETTLASPRFDEAAAQMARPVIPLSEEVLSSEPGHASSPGSPLITQPARNASWLLAAVVGLILVAGATAIGVNAYRRNPVASNQPLAPVAEATRIEIDEYPGLSQPSSSDAPAIARPRKRAQRVERPRPAFVDKTKPRMVDSYVIR